LLQYDVYRRMLAAHFDEPQDAAVTKIEKFEEEVKKRFVEQPGQMKLLIVVDKLLTGFDAPPTTYLYIDKQMRDHGLFQAICRANRLDDESKNTATSSTTRICSNRSRSRSTSTRARPSTDMTSMTSPAC
jgi:type I restriction enzyme R subunit